MLFNFNGFNEINENLLYFSLIDIIKLSNYHLTENTMGSIREESPAKRRKISKDSFLDIIEDPRTPLKIQEKAPIMPIEVKRGMSIFWHIA